MVFYSDSGAMDFQEFEVRENSEGYIVYQLERWSKDRVKLEDLADDLTQGNGLEVSDYVIVKKEDFYALYIR